MEGHQEKLITKDLFLLVNNIRAAAKGKNGVTHKKESDEYPLKIFMQCDGCGTGYTGYVVKKTTKAMEKCINSIITNASLKDAGVTVMAVEPAIPVMWLRRQTKAMERSINFIITSAVLKDAGVTDRLKRLIRSL